MRPREIACRTDEGRNAFAPKPRRGCPKRNSGRKPGDARETEKPCKGAPVPVANGCARSRVAPTGLVGFSVLPQVSTRGFKEGRPRRGLFKVRKDFQKPRRGEIAQRRVPTLRKMRKRRARCKCAIAGTPRSRENLPRNSRIDADFLSTNCSNFTNLAGLGNAARRMFVFGHPNVAGTKAGLPSPPKRVPAGIPQNPSNPCFFSGFAGAATAKKLRAGGRLGAF